MQVTDRDEFTRQVSVLCAAWNVPLGDRADMLWRAFYKLDLDEFTRIVDHAISPDAEIEKFPTVRQLWQCRKAMRGSSVRPPPPKGMQAALVEYVLRHRKVSQRQKAFAWNWIARSWPDPSKDNPERIGYEILGVIVPQDDENPNAFQAVRALFADVDWQQYLEGGRA